jgi:thiol:disulfide interchange protein DsbD
MTRWLFPLLFLLSALLHADEFLDPAVAFKPSARAIDGQTIEVRFAIAPDYYLYRDKFRFAAEPATVQLGTAILPPGKEKHDETFGKVEVYYQEAVIRLPVERNSSGPLPLTLKVTSQGCADAGICYPPQQQKLSLELPDPATAPVATPAGNVPVADESGRIAQLFRHAGFWLLVGSFFGFGLLLSLTPCVFPMIPILSSIIVGSGRDGHGVSHARGFSLSLAYVLGMAITYAAAGIAAGLTGTLLAAALQNPWVLGSFAAVFVAAVAVDVRFLRDQLPVLPAKQGLGRGQPPPRWFVARGGGDGRAVGDHRRPLRCRAAGRRPALHRPDRRRRTRGRGAVLDGARHGRAAAGGRRLGRDAAAEVWRVDGGGQERPLASSCWQPPSGSFRR